VDPQTYFSVNGLDDLVARFDAARANPGAPRPIAPMLPDLVRLHRLVIERRRLTVLEFGVGYSTLILADALSRHEAAFRSQPTANLELPADAFRLYSVDADATWIRAVRAGLPGTLAGRVDLVLSPVRATTFEGRLCHCYQRLPDVVPDFIYLDGPHLGDVQGTVNGLSFCAGKRVPIAADVLLMEPSLLPGTIVLLDGRTANARFLAQNLRREFRSSYDAEADVTQFELVEPPLGPRDAVRLAYQANGH
jgi:hypothetical protein